MPLPSVYVVLMFQYGEPPMFCAKSVRIDVAELPDQLPYQM
ncbi:MAG TPA: hypothetical protein VHB21_06010 [Minicystis sp.]|nr:hypothetical protein [Minicystis sp.]